MAILGVQALFLSVLLIQGTESQSGTVVELDSFADRIADNAGPLIVRASAAVPPSSIADQASPEMLQIAPVTAEPKSPATLQLEAPLRVEARSVLHVVRPGDTLYRLAQTYGASVEQIRESNGLAGDRLAVGSRLKVLKRD
jgi:LysM repeat protein